MTLDQYRQMCADFPDWGLPNATELLAEEIRFIESRTKLEIAAHWGEVILGGVPQRVFLLPTNKDVDDPGDDELER